MAVRRTWNRILSLTLLSLGGALWPAVDARAFEFLVEAQTQGDAYQLVTSGNEVLNRRRLHQYLGLSLWDLTGDGSQALTVRTMFRFDADFGLSDDEVERTTLTRDHLSIQYAYVDGHDLLGGYLDFRLGRHLKSDALDFIMLDGVSLKVGTPIHIEGELELGLEVKDDLFSLNANALETDGTRLIATGENDFTDAAAAQTTAADKASYVVGVALATRDLTYGQYRIGYRRVFSNLAVDSEKIGGAFRQRIVDGLDLSGLASWDLFNGRFDRIQAAARWRITDWTDLEAEYVRLLPSFDADSIFNIFTAFALNDLNLRWRLHPSAADRIYAGGMMRLFGNEGYTDGALTGDVDTVVSAFGAMAGWGHWFGPQGRDGRMSLDVSFEGGYGGDRLLVDLTGVWALVPQEWELEGRLTAVNTDDETQTNLHAFSFGYQLGGRYLIDSRAAFALVAEHNMNRLHSHQLRVFALVDVALWL